MLLTLPNPKYNEIINKYSHLGGIKMHETHKKSDANSFYTGSEWFRKNKNGSMSEGTSDW